MTLPVTPGGLPESAFPLVIELAGEPKGKGRPRVDFVRRRTYTPEKTVRYENALAHEAALVMRGRPPLTGALSIEVRAFMPVPASWSKRRQAAALAGRVFPTGKPDFDNLLKCLDALNKIVWRDDALVVSAVMHKRFDERPRLEVTVRQIGEAR